VKKSKDSGLRKAELIVKAACDKKADRPLIMDMRKFSTICDYFLVMSGTSKKRVQAISDNIEAVLAENDHRLWHLEGYSQADWIVADYADVVAHIFYEPVREFYGLERLWGDAAVIRFKPTDRRS
jgi:ribosome-associated protein